ncbi:MAG: ArsR family transcriptional regulator [Methanobacteriota archaeon]|nr:MAG: ArsR family transcriptional regulator [Euryarchaeota archaeon]
MDNYFEEFEEAYREAQKVGVCSCKNLAVYVSKIQSVKEKISEDMTEWYEQLFKVLANETRLKILIFLIKQKKSCICEIATTFEIDRGTLTYHLKLLRQVGLIKLKKVGKSKRVSISENYDQLLPGQFLQDLS